ncbi:MAG: WcaF family extracellular polysaccharide biosynthesis acetyltransferase [Bacteroidia bacterium]|jgi:putative colanic acid biosynthesis acetyltransferase WcaF|nr:WcaF family extracellular polysaccharide biosynthesis acetyltransferase [Bacteroidia bacterium]MCO5253505.1 WcaF family extracellular polysaccharide biosynthesis acetyltransferase [Bacteroidota bacterium]MCZ2131513.1 WcaF family extracellular polysaccharide biosynthesis acetyltransferase [Bacteroidia bacterium]
MSQKQTQLKDYQNKDFERGRSLLITFIWYAVSNIFINSYLFPSYTLKRFLLRLFGAEIGIGVLVKPKVNIKYPWKLKIGNHVWIGENVWIDNLDKITIGNNVCISQGAMLICGNHNYKKSEFDLTTKPIVLEEGVWLGAKSIVSGGVTCKSHSVLSIASVASSDLAPYSIYRGNPAIKIKDRNIA